MPTRLHLPATDITQSLVKDSDVYVCTTMQIGKRISLMNPRVRQVPVSLTNMIPTYSCLEQDKMPLSLMMSKVQFPIFSHSLLTKAAIRATLIRQHSGQLVAAKSLEWELAPVFFYKHTPELSMLPSFHLQRTKAKKKKPAQRTFWEWHFLAAPARTDHGHSHCFLMNTINF